MQKRVNQRDETRQDWFTQILKPSLWSCNWLKDYDTQTGGFQNINGPPIFVQMGTLDAKNRDQNCGSILVQKAATGQKIAPWHPDW